MIILKSKTTKESFDFYKKNQLVNFLFGWSLLTKEEVESSKKISSNQIVKIANLKEWIVVETEDSLIRVKNSQDWSLIDNNEEDPFPEEEIEED